MPTPSNLSIRLFEILVREHHRGLLTYASALTHGDTHLAEDIVQDALIVAYNKAMEFDLEKDFGAWVRGIIRNKAKQAQAIKYKQRRMKSELGQQHHNQMDVSPELLEEFFVGIEQSATDWREISHVLEECLSGLSDRLADTIKLKYYQKLTTEDIEAKLRCSQKAISKRIERGKALLFACISQKIRLQG